MDVLNENSNTDQDCKGVPGFSKRFNELFDMAGAPKDTRLAWGAAKWGCAPNTIGNWIKKDSPPQRYTTLQSVVADLLLLIQGRYDANEVIGWLYTGTANPFVEKQTSTNMEPINHVLQVKIFNRLYQMCIFKDFDLDEVDINRTNKIISVIYWYLHFRQKAGLSADVKDAGFIMKTFVASLAESGVDQR